MRHAIELSLKVPQLLVNRAVCYLVQKHWRKVLDDLDTAIRIAPRNALALNRRAVVKSCCPEERYRDGKRAVEDATQACKLTG